MQVNVPNMDPLGIHTKNDGLEINFLWNMAVLDTYINFQGGKHA